MLVYRSDKQQKTLYKNGYNIYKAKISADLFTTTGLFVIYTVLTP